MLASALLVSNQLLPVMTDDSTFQRRSSTARLSESTVRRIIGGSLALAGLLALLATAAFLPAVGRLVDGLVISPLTLGIAVATLLVVGTVLVLAPAARLAVEELIDGPPALAKHAGAAAMWFVSFAAVGIAYRGLAGAATPLLDAFGIAGMYHLTFLALGLLTLGLFARQLYRCWRPLTDRLTAYLQRPTSPRTGDRSAGE